MWTDSIDARPISTLPSDEKPRERCLQAGPNTLSLRECIALILGSGPRGVGCLGLAQKIISRPGKGLQPAEEERAFFMSMESSGRSHLMDIPGLGEAGQARLLAAIELGRRYACFRGVSERRRDSETTQAALRPSLEKIAIDALRRISDSARNESHEWFGFIPVYSDSRLGELCLVEKGSRTHVNLDPVEIFARILALRPQGFYLVHNHPSGNSQPSPQDHQLTQEIQQVASRLGVRLLGHWVVSPMEESWISTGATGS